MPDTQKYKSVAVPVPTWEKLGVLAARNNRSPAQHIAHLVNISESFPTDEELLKAVPHLLSRLEAIKS